ncbi:MAG: two-component system sensor histidine kinase NtrB [Alphaproteobacteria bacterium]
MSARLLLMTVMFVLLAEVVIYIPSVAKFRRDRLMTTITNVQIAALVQDAQGDVRHHEDLERNLMKRLGVLAVVLQRRDGEEVLLSSGANLPTPERTVDIGGGYNPVVWIGEAFDGFFASNDRILKVNCKDRWDMGGRLIIYMYERPLRQAMLTYSGNIFWLSLIIAVLVSACVYTALYYIAVSPIRRIIMSMIHFSEKPEDASRIIKPKARGTELAAAERALAGLQTQVRAALQQKSRLAALGTAVSKINHDLRNILASSQLISERLAAIDDPTAKAMAPKLVAALDRATALCTNTLRFGRAEEPPPDFKLFTLHDLVGDVATMLDLQDQDRISWRMDVDKSLTVYADPDHVFRVLLNLVRNAVQAVNAVGENRERRVSLRAKADGPCTIIELEDTGPGIPEQARARLFEAFISTAREGGTGLGLAIAAELVEANGGRIELVRSDDQGTVFCLRLPRQEPA